MPEEYDIFSVYPKKEGTSYCSSCWHVVEGESVCLGCGADLNEPTGLDRCIAWINKYIRGRKCLK